jgi:predicted CopG family antitoxin
MFCIYKNINEMKSEEEKEGKKNFSAFIIEYQRKKKKDREFYET